MFLLQMLVERREPAAIKMNNASAALALEQAAACLAAMIAELIARTLIGCDLVDGSLPLQPFQLPVDGGEADAFAAAAQLVKQGVGAHAFAAVRGDAGKHGLVLFGGIGRQGGTS